ncbi:uncharacterized protein LOC133545223 [Nerophis ophidion]|uniref:uncharacterized protein LOC133545223 n=1 Tax=Nerophis ophidion TaxID=159077 RepID=UPI002ADF4FAF|nr:uncharacterized protein LOC133545223 [Nerophis ophidion]
MTSLVDNFGWIILKDQDRVTTDLQLSSIGPGFPDNRILFLEPEELDDNRSRSLACWRFGSEGPVGMLAFRWGVQDVAEDFHQHVGEEGSRLWTLNGFSASARESWWAVECRRSCPTWWATTSSACPHVCCPPQDIWPVARSPDVRLSRDVFHPHLQNELEKSHTKVPKSPLWREVWPALPAGAQVSTSVYGAEGRAPSEGGVASADGETQLNRSPSTEDVMDYLDITPD